MSAKADLRRRMKAMRDALPEDERQECSRYICKTAAELPQSGDTVFVYASVGSEVQTDELIRLLWDRGCRVCLPKIIGKGLMNAVEYRPGDDLMCDRFGIPAPQHGKTILPQDVQTVFVPALAFDASGTRLGYGGGYYDRWLSDAGAKRVLLAYASQQVDAISAEEWDMPVDMAVTERGILRFR